MIIVPLAPLVRCDPSQRTLKRDEIGFLLVGEPDIEALVIELYDIAKRRCRAVMKIGRPRCQAAQDRPLHFADIGTLPGDRGTARVGDLEHLAGQWPGCAPDRENRQPDDVQGWRATNTGVCNANV